MNDTQLMLHEYTATPPDQQQQAIQQAVTTWLKQTLEEEGRYRVCAVPSTSG